MHVTESVFLKKSPVSETEAVYEFWSREFGKIRAFTREKKGAVRLDTGSLFQASIETKGEKNRLTGFKLRRNLSTENLDYASALGFLRVVKALSNALPEGVPNLPLFDEFRECHPFFEDGAACRKTGSFFLLKFAKTLGTWKVPDDASEHLLKLERAASSYSVTELLNIRGISESLLTEAETATARAFTRYHS